MTDDDRKRLGLALTQLAEAFNRDLSPETLRIYVGALDDLTLDAALTAIDVASRTCRFFPVPAELRERAGAGLPDAGLVSALIAQHLRSERPVPGYPRAHLTGESFAPDDPFLRLVFDRLGGTRRAADLLPADRLRLLTQVLPGVVSACTARGITLPTEALAAPDAPPRLALVGPTREVGRAR